MKLKHTQIKGYGKGTQVSLNQAARLSQSQLAKNIFVGNIKMSDGSNLIGCAVTFGPEVKIATK